MNAAAKIIITVLSIVTVVAILVGVYIHIFRGFSFSGSSKIVEGIVDLEGDVEKLEFDVDFGDITVKYGEEFSVAYSMPESLVPKVSLEDGVLKVKTPSGNNFSFPFTSSGNYEILVILPEGTELSNLNVNLDAGNIRISDIPVANLVMDVDVGNIKLTDIESDRFDINVDAGNFEVKNITVDRVNIDADAGNVDIQDSVIENLYAEVDAGNIESHNSTINSGNCETDMGNISLNGEIGNVNVKTSLGNASIN